MRQEWLSQELGSDEQVLLTMKSILQKQLCDICSRRHGYYKYILMHFYQGYKFQYQQQKDAFKTVHYKSQTREAQNNFRAAKQIRNTWPCCSYILTSINKNSTLEPNISKWKQAFPFPIIQLVVFQRLNQD